MLSILGVGYAYPDTLLNNDLLAKLGAGCSSVACAVEGFGIKTRASSLPLEYFTPERDFDPVAGFKAMTTTPTGLLSKAAAKAIEISGISAQQIGLIMGDTTTPLETTPGEAQRIGRVLGLSRVPAYDVTGSSIALPLHLSILDSWKPDRVPEYVLLVSANTPTQCIDYRSGMDGALYGDGAMAAVVSAAHTGPLKLLRSEFSCESALGEGLTLGTYGVIKTDFPSLMAYVAKKLEAALEKLSNAGLLKGRVLIAGPDLNMPVARQLFNKFGISNEHCISSVERIGYSFGSSPGISLGEQWSKLANYDLVVVFAAGAGFSFGSVVFEVA